MEEERQIDDIQQEGSAPASSTEQQPDLDQPSSDPVRDTDAPSGERTGDGDQGEPDGDAIKIPKHRYDEMNKKWAEKYASLENRFGDMQGKFEGMAQALQGESKDTRDSKLQEFAKKYNVPDAFVQEFMEMAESSVTEKFNKQMMPVKQQQAKTAFTNELNNLFEEIPDARDMTKEEKENLQKMAYDPKYSRTPLSDIYKIMNFGKPQGQKHSVESGRSGASRAQDRTTPDISSMSLDDFEKFSEDLARKQK